VKEFFLMTSLAAFVFASALPMAEAAPAKSRKPAVHVRAVHHQKPKRHVKKVVKQHGRKAPQSRRK